MLPYRNTTFWERGQKWEVSCAERDAISGDCKLSLPRPPAWHNGTGADPWAAGTAGAPFDQQFYLQMNVAVGGTGSFFPDLLCRGKPWTNGGSNPKAAFTAAFDEWWPTWGGQLNNTQAGAARSAALAIDWVRYWAPGEEAPHHV